MAKIENYPFVHSRFLYPGILALLVSSISYPLGTGQFIAGELSTHEQVSQLFSNFTWTKTDLTVEQATIVTNWTTSISDVFINLTAYALFTVLASYILYFMNNIDSTARPIFSFSSQLLLQQFLYHRVYSFLFLKLEQL